MEIYIFVRVDNDFNFKRVGIGPDGTTYSNIMTRVEMLDWVKMLNAEGILVTIKF